MTMKSSMYGQEWVAGETLGVMVGSTEPGGQRCGMESCLCHMSHVIPNSSGSLCVNQGVVAVVMTMMRMTMRMTA